VSGGPPKISNLLFRVARIQGSPVGLESPQTVFALPDAVHGHPRLENDPGGKSPLLDSSRASGLSKSTSFALKTAFFERNPIQFILFKFILTL
jgi:hypothetical protein